LTSCLTGLDLSVLQIKTKIVSSHTADCKPVKQQVNCTVILPPLVFPALKVLHSGWLWPYADIIMGRKGLHGGQTL
jgi:hypothetical protein